MDEHDRRARTHRTVDALQERMLAHDMPGFAALWAPDGRMDFPFAAAPSPTHLEGRDAVEQYVAGYNQLLLPREIVAETRYDTADPDTVVSEITVAGRVAPTGADYALRYVAIVTIGDAGVLSYRDYWNPVAMHALMAPAGAAS